MVTIVEVPPPASADDPNAWAARAQTRLWNAESVALLGYADLTDTEEAGVRWAVPSAHRMSLRWIALTDPDDHDTVVGCGTLQLTLKDNLTSAGLFVVVTPEHRRRGIGSQLFAAGELRSTPNGRLTTVSGRTMRSPSLVRTVRSGLPAQILQPGHEHRRPGHPLP